MAPFFCHHSLFHISVLTSMHGCSSGRGSSSRTSTLLSASFRVTFTQSQLIYVDPDGVKQKYVKKTKLILTDTKHDFLVALNCYKIRCSDTFFQHRLLKTKRIRRLPIELKYHMNCNFPSQSPT